MNYLSHFVFNHDVRGLPQLPHFSVGVALPDLWPRVSRTHRIRWPALRAARPVAARDLQLRAGLLNHVAADARFHTCPLFHGWVRQGRARLAGFALHPAIADFLSHVAVELALDHHLVRADPALTERFYRCLECCDPDEIAARVSRLGSVAAQGLGRELREFTRRRFLARYADPAELAAVLRFVLGLTRVAVSVPPRAFAAAIAAAVECAQPAELWPQLRAQAAEIAAPSTPR